MKFQLDIITPEKIVYQQEANEVIVPTVSGQIAILPHHVSLITQIEAGELTIKNNGKDLFIAIAGGFLEVHKNNVSILADYAVHADTIDEAKAQEAKERAERVMQEKTTQRDLATAEAQLRRSLTELKVVRKRRKVL